MQFTTEEFEFLHETTGVLIRAGISLLLYGIYICLFLLSIRVLSCRATPGRKLLIVFSCVMAVVGTVAMAIEIFLAVISARHVQELVHGGSLNKLAEEQTLGKALDITTIVNLFISDSFFLFRCYVIWGYRWKVAILPAVLILSTFTVGILATANDEALFVTYYGLAAAANFVLTTLTAGRIFWVWRHASCLSVDTNLRGRYNTALKLVFESGAIYCVGIVFLLIGFEGNEDIYVITTAFAGQALNIIPTFTLVYVGLNNSGDPTQESGSYGPSSETPIAPRMRTVQQRDFSQILDIKPLGEQTDNQCA
ncbi:hypothetical protein DFH08DRAFT_1089006 [Mycena albidolilacea]|uniref:Uncharacterized protein n=1 Tax=Mycena albidolilacea TaxID=1033008 RepID=A0AAD6Z3P2_9AGAR|nr:hypothetical protein DFH08DRAFT_1089006 [Mycena albidolilacea]